MLFRSLSALALLAVLPSAPAPVDDFVCPPCSVACHDLSYSGEGSCSTCGMELVPRASVPHVAVLLYEGVDIASSTGPLGVFAASHGSFVFTVGDTTDPLRLEDALTLVPQHDLASAPRPSVLVVPSGNGRVWEDELVLEWIRSVAADAQHVIGIGSGNVALAKAGLVPQGRVPAPGWMVRRAADLGLEGRLTEDAALVELGKVTLARDASAGLEAALDTVHAINGSQTSERTARALGFQEER